jgi:CPA2 family monovalent cation:H+ antiporter-2
MGSILAETVEAEHIEKLVEPVKNLFGAVFFVSVGMLVDLDILVEYAFPIIALVLTILIGQSIFGSLSFLLGGESLKSAMRCGFSMAQIGEFSFIIASLGLSLGVISDYLYPVVVAVSVITTFLTPYMIRLSTPAYTHLEKHLPNKMIKMLNHLSMSQPNTNEQSNWKKILVQMGVNTLVYSILTSATIAIMFTFASPFMHQLLPGPDLEGYANAITGLLTILLIAPFLRAMVMKKNRSLEFRALWAESNRNRLPLLFTILVRGVIAVAFIFYICNRLTHFSNAIMITIAILAVLMMVLSRGIKNRSIRLERLFILNLRSREIEAQVHGKKRPLYEGRLLDRDIHIADFNIPMDSKWMGCTLRQLDLGRKYGVHVISILRANHRLNIPYGNYIIFPGDKLQVIGSDDQLSKFGQAINEQVIGEDPNLEHREMKLRQLIIGSDSPFIGKTLEESGIRDIYSCMVVGLEEGKKNLSPFSPKRRFQEGDIIWIVGEIDALQQLLR